MGWRKAQQRLQIMRNRCRAAHKVGESGITRAPESPDQPKNQQRAKCAAEGDMRQTPALPLRRGVGNGKAQYQQPVKSPGRGVPNTDRRHRLQACFLIHLGMRTSSSLKWPLAAPAWHTSQRDALPTDARCHTAADSSWCWRTNHLDCVMRSCGGSSLTRL